ncbi:MAG: hypothetical protein AMXMBFR82_17840 [Candidatus Hydrogenedentota bacterium]
MTGLHELIFLMLIVAVLSMTGLWPQIIRGIRQLRGERVEDDTPPPSDREVDLCYKLLGLSPSSSWDQVEKAYRAKAKLHHPDHGGDDDTMRALNEAYALLKRMKKSSPRRQ